MQPYWCYLLDTTFHIARTEIVECSSDDEARRRGRSLLATNPSLYAVEVWDATRRVCGYSGDGRAASDDAAPQKRDRKSTKAIRDAVLAARRDASDRIAAAIAEDRRRKLQAEALKTARLRELRLAHAGPLTPVARTAAMATILLVEDDAAFAYALSKSLRAADHHVITALDGMSALKALDTDMRIDVLLTDIVLPARQPHGLALAHMARQKRNDIAVIFMTGYDELGKEIDGYKILVKPVETQTVLDEITASLLAVRA
jgi:CheY-like chemotaxis protein